MACNEDKLLAQTSRPHNYGPSVLSGKANGFNLMGSVEIRNRRSAQERDGAPNDDCND